FHFGRHQERADLHVRRGLLLAHFFNRGRPVLFEVSSEREQEIFVERSTCSLQETARVCGRRQSNRNPPLCATSGLMQCSTIRSFDNTTSARKQCRRQFEAERLGCLEVDEQLNLCGLLDGQIGQLLIL